MHGACGPAAVSSTSATTASPALAVPRRRQDGPCPRHSTSSRSASPGITGRRKRARSTATRRRPPSSAASVAPSCTKASQISTPGNTGAPGKCPTKYGSLALTSFVPTARTPGSTASTRSTSRYGKPGGVAAPRCGSFTMRVLLLLLVLAPPGFGLLVRRGVVDLHDLVGDVG